jgi:RNA polymerase sigma-70 factor, ECF subfamily
MSALLTNAGPMAGATSNDVEPDVVASVQSPSVERDRRIVERLLAGDDQALVLAYNTYGAYVYRLARRVTAHEQAARDITQDVFVHLWERPDSIDLNRGSLRTFLGIMCHHRAVDLVRREERRRTRETLAGVRVEPQVDVAEAASAAVSAKRVRTALAALPEHQRVPLTLAYFDGLTYRQVARALNIPEGTAKSRLRHALQALARHLADESATRDCRAIA